MIGAVARRGRRAPPPTQSKSNRPGVCIVQLVGGVGGLGGVNARLTACDPIVARLTQSLIYLSSFALSRFFGAFGAVVGIVQFFFKFFSNFIDEWLTV